MKHRVVFIHTVSGLTPFFDELLGGFTDRAETLHIADDTLIRAIVAAKGLTPAVRARLREHVLAADGCGAAFIQFTCSSVSPCAAELAPLAKAPILTIDGPMAQEVAARFHSIGVLATNPGTIQPSAQILRDAAAARGTAVRVEPVLCADAYAAYLAGDRPTHDRIVRENLLALMGKVEAVVLAQASMARIADALAPAERTVPVFTSPRPAMAHLAGLLNRP